MTYGMVIENQRKFLIIIIIIIMMIFKRYYLLLIFIIIIICVNSVSINSYDKKLLLKRIERNKLLNKNNNNNNKISPSLIEYDTQINSPCANCQKFVTALATSSIQLSLTLDQTVLKAQSLLSAMGLCSSLKVQCNVYNDVQIWLNKMGILDTKTTNMDGLNSAIQNPQHRCHLVDICGVIPWVPLPQFSHHETGDSVVLRLRLKNNIASIPHSEVRWSLFVKRFLQDIANYLHIDVARLQLHQATNDRLTEIVIRHDSKASIKDPSPRELALRMKAVLAPGSNALNVPPYLLNVVNSNVRIEVMPLNIPTNINPTNKMVQNKTIEPADCVKLLEKKDESCSNSFKCTSQCQDDYRRYFGACLTKQLTHEEALAKHREAVRFFTICHACTPERVNMVKNFCDLNGTAFESMKSMTGKTCTAHCASEFVPYFDTCIAVQEESYTEDVRNTVMSFRQECSKCVKKRTDAIHTLCGIKGHYPATCTKDCATLFPGYYDECLAKETNLTAVLPGSKFFRQRCQTQLQGGEYVRLTFFKDITSILHMSHFRQGVINELATMLRCNSTRFEVTGVLGSDRNQTKEEIQLSNNSTDLKSTHLKVFVDIWVKMSNDKLDPDPSTLIDTLRVLLSNPRGTYRALPIMHDISSNIGVQNLVAKTHTVAQYNGPSSLDLARMEVQKAKEHGAPSDMLHLLDSIVKYHEDVRKGVSTTQTTFDLEQISYNAVVAHNAPLAQVQYYKARLEYARTLNEHPDDKQTLDEQHAHMLYLGDIMLDAKENVKQRDQAMWNWRKAIKENKDPKTLAVLAAIYRYFKDLAAGAQKEILNYDQAELNLAQAILSNTDNETLAYRKSIKEYMYDLMQHKNSAVVNAAFALVEYHQAIMEHWNAKLIAKKKHLLDYLVAVRDQKESAVIQQLAAVVKADVQETNGDDPTEIHGQVPP